MGMHWRNARYSACAADVEASCGGLSRARSAYPRPVPTSAKDPTGPPDGGSVRSPVTYPSGHRLPGSLPQRIAEVCPLPTRIVLSYLMNYEPLSRSQKRASWGMFARRAAAGLRPAVMCPIHIRPAAAACFGTRGAPRELAVADRLWLPAGYRCQLARSLLHVSAAEVPRALARTPNGDSALF